MEELKKSQKKSSDEKLYTQAELENIVEARLSRERKNNESLVRVRETLNTIRKKDAFKNLSNAALSERLSQLAAGFSADETPAIVPEKEKMPPATPDAAENAENGRADDKAEMTAKDSDGNENRNDELSEFIELYGEERFDELMKDKTFKSFCRNRGGDLLSLYEDYVLFLDRLDHAGSAKRTKAAQRGLASTGFSGYAAGSTDYAGILTENQKRIAQTAGMSYKQYAELLSQIPTKKVGK